MMMTNDEVRRILTPMSQDELLKLIASPADTGHIPPEVLLGSDLVAVPEAGEDGVRCRLMPRTTATDLVRVERELVRIAPAPAQDVEWHLCKHDRAYFIARWLDIETKFPIGKDRSTPFLPFLYQLRIIRLYDRARAEQRGIFEEKSRQLGLSWLWMALFLHGLLFEDQASFFATSRRQDEVDDGGRGSTTKSIFGRLRFMYERLPAFLRQDSATHKDVLTFKLLSVLHTTSGSYLSGEAATANIGRGGSFTVGLLDEFAHIEQSESAWASADEAIQCPIVSSTPFGEDNKFADLRDKLARPKNDSEREVRKRFLVSRSHWSEHPYFARGIARGEDGRLTSPWYRRACATKTPEKAAQEYDIAYAGSLPGRFFPEFSRGVHVPLEEIALHTGYWFYLSADHGLSDTEVWGLWQTDGSTFAELLDEWHSVPEGSHHGVDLTSREVAAGIVEWLREEWGLPLGRIEGIIPDPAGGARDETSGQSHHDLLKATWSRLGQKIPAWWPANNSIVDGIESTRLLLAGTYNGKTFRLRVSPRCTLTIDSLINYRRRTLRDGRVTDQEHKDWTNHAADMFRYFCHTMFPAIGDVAIEMLEPHAYTSATQGRI